jgi:hypothetical protein
MSDREPKQRAGAPEAQTRQLYRDALESARNRRAPLKFAAVLLDVIVIGMHCGALDIACSLENQGNLYCAFLPISRGLIFAASGVHGRDSPRHCICDSWRPRRISPQEPWTALYR